MAAQKTSARAAVGPCDRGRCRRAERMFLSGEPRRLELKVLARMQAEIDLFTLSPEERGFGGLIHLDLAVEGIHCAGCMAKIERNCRLFRMSPRPACNLTDSRLALEWKAGALDPALFVNRLAGTRLQGLSVPAG